MSLFGLRAKLGTMKVITLDDPPCDVRVVRNARARRFTLRLESKGGGAVLTVPPGVQMRDCQSFLLRHTDWLTRALAKQPRQVVVGDGILLPVDGQPLEIMALPGKRRAPEIEDGKLLLHGPGPVGTRLATWLKERARARLNQSARQYAEALGTTVNRVALRDTTSRWGSCSSSGTLSFSWRLAMAPIPVQDYLAAHEAAHLIEMNHSDRFWALVERLMPDWKPQRDWLRREGKGLHAYRFD